VDEDKLGLLPEGRVTLRRADSADPALDGKDLTMVGVAAAADLVVGVLLLKK
jgi:hypothetical protein